MRMTAKQKPTRLKLVLVLGSTFSSMVCSLGQTRLDFRSAQEIRQLRNGRR